MQYTLASLKHLTPSSSELREDDMGCTTGGNPNRGRAAEHVLIPREGISHGFPCLPWAGVCPVCISAGMGIIKQKTHQILHR